jgi:hypothetical protein
MSPFPRRVSVRFVDGTHPAGLDERVLLRQCNVAYGRASGPGGQHRNKVETAVSIVHEPTGIAAAAGERRSQSQNRSAAIARLRRKLAVEVRTRTHPERHRPSACWARRRQGRTISVNPHHRDYPELLSEALDVIVARGFDVAGAAGVLGVSMSQLAKLVRHDKHAFTAVNEGRAGRGLPPLR